MHVRAHAAAALSHTPDGAVPDICGNDWPLLHVQAYAKQPSRSTGQPVGPPSSPGPPLDDEEAEVDGALELQATTSAITVASPTGVDLIRGGFIYSALLRASYSRPSRALRPR